MAGRKKSIHVQRRQLPFGICSVACAPIRLKPSDTSEMISQLLFGECVQVHRKYKSWVFIRCTLDGYEGWVDLKQIIRISNEEHLALSSDYACSIEVMQVIYNTENAFPVLLGSSLPHFDGLHVRMPDSKFVCNGLVLDPTSVEITPERIERLTKLFLHAPYLWGGRSVFGIDCSGFTQVVFKMLGLAIPRDASQQVHEGTIIDFVANAQVGDLAYFENEQQKVIHVGIVLDDHKIIHASGKVRIDTLDHHGIFNSETKRYTHKLKIIKRILPEFLTINAIHSSEEESKLN